jgi:hypothetical protein
MRHGAILLHPGRQLILAESGGQQSTPCAISSDPARRNTSSPRPFSIQTLCRAIHCAACERRLILEGTFELCRLGAQPAHGAAEALDVLAVVDRPLSEALGCSAGFRPLSPMHSAPLVFWRNGTRENKALLREAVGVFMAPYRS